jgi:uncharacterized membrane protein YkvA (DUF1232 family)
MTPIEKYAEKLDGTDAGERPSRLGWKSRARDCLEKACIIYLILKDSESPWPAKMVAALSVGYIFSPIQLIPSFIPVIGWLDDMAVVFAGMWLLTRLTPPAIMARCRENAAAMLAKWLREEGGTHGRSGLS